MPPVIELASPQAASHAAADPVLVASGLSVSYGPIRVLSEVDLRVRSGEIVAVTGEPGAGKTALIRCLAGDMAPEAGTVQMVGRDPGATVRPGAGDVAVVWQDLELCDNLDVAGNLLLGRETPRLMLSDARFHRAAASILEELEIPIHDTTRLVATLDGGQRQLLALARAVSREPRILLLDDPTGALGAAETAHVEALVARMRERGTAVVVASREIELILRIADRIVVLRHGRVVAELDPAATHPDDIAALCSGQEVDTSARRQLTRLQGLAGSLVSADPSSSMSLILSALGAALGSDQLCVHTIRGGSLICEASLGLTPDQAAEVAQVPVGPLGGPPGLAAAGEPLVAESVRGGEGWLRFGQIRWARSIEQSWSVPVVGTAGAIGAITVFRAEVGAPDRDELDLLTLYAGYAGNAIERDRLLDQVTARNRVLETIREMLETLAGPAVVSEGLASSLQSLRRGIRADEVALVTELERPIAWRAYAGPRGTHAASASASLRAAVEGAVRGAKRDGVARAFAGGPQVTVLVVAFDAPAGPAALVATLDESLASEAETALMEDAAHSLNLALEREEAGIAHQEAAALRRSRELQRGFLSRLSHELRTPLTAIRGYASSLLQPDVTWDGESEQRFLERISAESARLGRLVDDLLDFSAIESGVMRLQPDWCELRLVLEAAVACLPGDWPAAVSIRCEPGLPVVWADHDRLEQVFVNLLGNAFRHNPPGTRATVGARLREHEVELIVADDGLGLSPGIRTAPFDSTGRPRAASAGAGLGLSIARGIVEAHGGRIELLPVESGVTFRIRMPVEGRGSRESGSEPGAAAEPDDVQALIGAGDAPADAWPANG